MSKDFLTKRYSSIILFALTFSGVCFLSTTIDILIHPEKATPKYVIIILLSLAVFILSIMNMINLKKIEKLITELRTAEEESGKDEEKF